MTTEYTNCQYYKTATIAVEGLGLGKGEIVGVTYLGHRFDVTTYTERAVYAIKAQGHNGVWGHLFDTALTRFVF